MAARTNPAPISKTARQNPQIINKPPAHHKYSGIYFLSQQQANI